MTFGYQSLYDNDLNNESQIRRAVDMAYQRGATYQLIVTGDTYCETLQLETYVYIDNEVIGKMILKPANITVTGYTYYYEFNIRPYDYVKNKIKSEHYTHYWLNDWYTTTTDININNIYSNNVTFNIRYRYFYTEDGKIPSSIDKLPLLFLTHYTMTPFVANATTFVPSGFTSTGYNFDLVGGSFQMDERLILQNFDQEVGSTINDSYIYTLDITRRYSPMSQFLFDYPMVPEMSETSRFLTEAPRIQYIQDDENYVLYYLNGQSGDRQVIEADFAVFEFYDSDNTKVLYFEQELNFKDTIYESPLSNFDTLKVFSLPVGPKDIDNLFEVVDWSTVDHYRVQIFYGLPTNNSNRSSIGALGPVSEAFWFYIKENCGPEDVRLVWLNERGGYDYYTFTSYRQDTKKIKRSTFDNRYFAENIPSPDRDIGRTLKTFDINVTREFELKTDYLTQPYGDWIEGLFTSPQVYEMKPDFVSDIDKQDKIYKDLRPVQVLSTKVDTINKNHKKLNQYKITLSYATPYFTNTGF